MKSVGKQLEEARLAKNWTPELAARETKIKVDRLRDLEVDDYSHFSSPTYARGFVRTYARSLGLDEYRILRQLDNKLPEDDNASFANDTGLPYVPEPSKSTIASSVNSTGLYVVMGLGIAVALVISFVLLQAYRAGELPRYFASSSSDNPTNAASTNTAPLVDSEAPAHALPVDPNDTTHSVRALPVDLNAVAATDTNAAPVPAGTNLAPVADVAPAAPVASSDASSSPTDIPAHALRALPVDPASLTNASPIVTNPAPAPVSAPAAPPAEPTTQAAPPPASTGPAPVSARASNATTTTTSAEPPPPRALPVDPSELASAAPSSTVAPMNATPSAPESDSGSTGTVVTTPVDLSAPTTPAANAPAPALSSNKSLVLTASRDSFVRVTSIGGAQGKEVLYASVLRAGQSVAFGGRKFSVNVGIPSAIDIALDGVNYGPHSDRESPETFTLESHQP